LTGWDLMAFSAQLGYIVPLEIVWLEDMISKKVKKNREYDNAISEGVRHEKYTTHINPQNNRSSYTSVVTAFL